MTKYNASFIISCSKEYNYNFASTIHLGTKNTITISLYQLSTITYPKLSGPNAHKELTQIHPSVNPRRSG